MNQKYIAVILYLIAVVLSHCSAATIYVDQNCNGQTHNGLGWDTAYTTIDDALLDAESSLENSDIWVAGGQGVTYVSQSGTFIVPEGVQLFGGFAGGETLLDQRDWVQNQTTIDSFVYVTGSSGNMSAVDGFKITGIVTWDTHTPGISLSGNVTFSHNIVTGNDFTGSNSDISLILCTGHVFMANNLMGNNIGDIDNIIVYCQSDSQGDPVIVNNTMVGEATGPAIHCCQCTGPTQISNNIIVNPCGIDASNPIPLLYNNCIPEMALPNYLNFPMDWTPPATELDADPQLTSDYHLQNTSPCRDSGSNDAVEDIGVGDLIDNDDIPTFAMSKDLDCRDRIQGDTVDRGAYETDATAPTLGSIVCPQYSNASSFAVSYSGVSDYWSGVDTIALWYKFGQGDWTLYATNTDDSTGAGSFTFTPADGDGTYYFALSAVDKANNGTDDPTTALGQTIFDTTAPSIANVSVSPILSSGQVDISFSGAVDSGSGLLAVGLFKLGTDGYYHLVYDPDTGQPYISTQNGATFTLYFSGNGTIDYYRLYAFDNAENCSAGTVVPNFTIDQTDPTAPANVVMDHVIPTTGLIHATWGASTDAHGIYCYAYQFWYKDSSGVKHNLGDLQGINSQEADYEFDGEYENDGMPYLSSTSAKTYGITVYAIDNAMNWSSAVDSDEVECKKVKVGYLHWYSGGFYGLDTSINNKLTALSNTESNGFTYQDINYGSNLPSQGDNINNYDVLLITIPSGTHVLSTGAGGELDQLVQWTHKWHKRLVLVGDSPIYYSGLNTYGQANARINGSYCRNAGHKC